MSHLRKQIRDNIITTVTGLATTSTRVYASRVYPLASDKMPGLCVYTNTEEIEFSTLNKPRIQTRTLEVLVEAYALAISGLDDTLDQICLEVEFSGDGEKPAGIARITVAVTYQCRENDLEVAI